MKTTFKKSVLAFLTCVLALAFALTGCSGGGKDPKANFVGSWELSGGTLEGEELTDEYMKMLEDWGVHCVLILDEDGTGALDLFLEVVDLKWEVRSCSEISLPSLTLGKRQNIVSRLSLRGRARLERRGRLRSSAEPRTSILCI